jgi:hypothetical protein
MYELSMNVLVTTLYLYLVTGSVVAIVILAFGLTRLDSETEYAGIGFRLIIFPGTVALWPLLLKRYVRGGGEPPLQKDPHR